MTGPPPSQAEIDRRNRLFELRHGFHRRTAPNYKYRGKSDWDVVNGK